MNKQERIEKRIFRLGGRASVLTLRLSATHYQIGKLLARLRDKIIPEGQWTRYIDDQETSVRLGLSRSTLYRCLSGYEVAQRAMNQKTISLFEKKGLDPGSPKVLGAVLEDRQEHRREKTANKPKVLVERVSKVISMRRRSPRKFGKPRRLTRLVAFAVRLYDDVPKIQVESDLMQFAELVKQKLFGVKVA